MCQMTLFALSFLGGIVKKCKRCTLVSVAPSLIPELVPYPENVLGISRLSTPKGFEYFIAS